MATALEMFNSNKVTSAMKKRYKEVKKAGAANTNYRSRLIELLENSNITFSELDDRINIPVNNNKTLNAVKKELLVLKEEFPTLDYAAVVVTTKKLISVKSRRI